MILNVTEAIAAREAKKGEQLEEEFHQWVIELDVAEAAPDPDSLIAKLQRLGKTSEDLQSALNRLRERRRLVGLIAEVPQHREDYSTHHAALTEELERFAPLRTAHEARVRELQSLRSQAQSGERDGGQAELQLRQTCSPKIRGDIKDTSERLDRLDRAIQQNGWDVESAETLIRDEPERWQQAYGTLDGVQESVERMTEQLAKLRTEGERLSALRPPLVEKLARLREESLTVESF